MTLAVAQVAMGVPSDRRFLRAARRQLGHLFKALPSQSAFHKRRVRLRETIEWLSGVFANSSPGSRDIMLLLDSAPVECGKSIDTSRAVQLAPADRPERDVALQLIPRAIHGGETIICDKGYAGKDFEHTVKQLGATIIRPARADEPRPGPLAHPTRQRVESIFHTLKDLLTLERHGAL